MSRDGSEIEEGARATAEQLVARHPEIVKVEDIQGGILTFSDSRLCVWVVIALIRHGESDEALLEGYPRLRPDLLAWLRAHI